MLSHLLPLLAISGVVASPLRPRQDASASVSSAIGEASSATSALASVASTPSTATGSASPASASVSASGNATAAAPSVTMYPDTSNGEPIVVNGAKGVLPGVDTYLGVPFAAPPVGDLRLSPPQSPIYNSTIDAVTQPASCLQSTSALYGDNYSEDCLYLNVYTPAGANAQTAWLPVMVWIYGGSFTGGGVLPYDGSIIVSSAAQAEKPVIVVALNYRLGVLGFGYGDEIAENGAANLGLKDQIKALEWVKQNIWAWGGDPDRVTVFGESAGAITISLMYLQQDIDLFRGAIMQSGAQSTAPIGPTSSTWQQPYDAIVAAIGCANGTSNSTESTQSSFECLKAAPAEAIIAAQDAVVNVTGGAFIFAPSIDGDLIPSSPHTLLEQGKFARIPFISGNVKDEGTLFTPTVINNETAVAALILALSPVDPPLDILQNAISMYPMEASAGSPFDTGNETFGLEPAYKQAAAILGDAQFQSQRRWFLKQANAQGLSTTWSYQFEQQSPSGAERLGVSHGSDVLYTFGAPIIGLGGNWTASDKAISAQLIDYWTSFANYLDPSEGLALPNATAWPSYGGDDERNMLRLLGGNVTVFPDTYRPQMEYFTTEPEAFNQRKRAVGA